MSCKSDIAEQWDSGNLHLDSSQTSSHGRIGRAVVTTTEQLRVHDSPRCHRRSNGMCPKVVKSCRRCRCLILPDSGLVRLGPPRPGAVQRTSQTGPACAQYRESLEDRHAGAKRDIQLGSRHPTNVPRSHRTWTHIHRVRSLPLGVNTIHATSHSRGILVRSDVVEECYHSSRTCDCRAQGPARPKSTVAYQCSPHHLQFPVSFERPVHGRRRRCSPV